MANPEPTMSQILSSANVPFFVTAVRELARQNRSTITDSGSALVGLGILPDAPLNLQIVLAALARHPFPGKMSLDTRVCSFRAEPRLMFLSGELDPVVIAPLFECETEVLTTTPTMRCLDLPQGWHVLASRVLEEATRQSNWERFEQLLFQDPCPQPAMRAMAESRATAQKPETTDADPDADRYYQKLSRARTRCAEALGSRPQCIGGDPIDIAARFVEASKEALNRIAAAVEVRGIGSRLPATNVWPEDVTRLTERILERLEKIPQEVTRGVIEELTETLRHMGATGK